MPRQMIPNLKSGHPHRQNRTAGSRFLLASRVWFLLAALVLTPCVIFGAATALGQRNNDIRQWLPADLPETRDYDWFLNHFGSEEFALISWEGASLEDTRVAGLHDRLESHSHLFREVLTGPEVLAELQDGGMQLSREEALGRIRGSLVGPDLQTTGILVRLTDHGQSHRSEAINTIRSEAVVAGVPETDLRLGGPTVESVALDEQSEKSRYLLTAVSLLLSSLAAWRCLKSVSLMFTVLLTAVFCGAASLAWVSVFGDQMSMIMVTMPTLVYVLAVSGAIHVAHYFRVSQQSVRENEVMAHALRSAWLPCVLTAVTTAIGLGSLTVSHVTPVRLFGFYSALGVLTSLPVVLFVLPAALSFLRPSADNESASPDLANRQPGARTEGRLTRMARAVMKQHAPITIVGIAVMAISIAGLSRLNTSVRIIDFFSPKSRVIADYQWLEKNLGPLVPVEVVVKLPTDSSLRMTNRIQLVREVGQALAGMPDVDGVVSAATYVPEPRPQRGLARLARRAAMERRLQNRHEELAATGYLTTGDQHELWRVSARVAAMNDIDYGRFVRDLKNVVQPVVAEHLPETTGTAEHADVVYTGMVPLVYKAQRVLLDDLTASFLSAFALIAVVMLFLMRGVRHGLISMVPNTFPAVVIFGLMGWLGHSIDVGAMITASVAMGIAVDDTIHFMSWFRRGLKAGHSRQNAILLAYRRCGAAMIQTTLICGLGMLAFTFSTFGPTSGFATLMITMLAASLVGDLVFLPAMLAGPLGRMFEPQSSTEVPLPIPVCEPTGLSLAAE